VSRFWGVVVGIAVAALAMAAPAAATTFCVPNTSFAACPSGSTAQANLETAMQTNPSDGTADKIYVAAGTQTETANGTFETAGTDALEILGAGPGTGAGATRLTSTGTGNQFVLLLNSRPVTVRDLTIVIPSSFPNTLSAGAGALLTDDTLENVDVESQNAGTIGADAVVIGAGSSFSDGAIYPSSAGSETGKVLDGFNTADAVVGSAEIVRTTITNPVAGVRLSVGNVVVTVRRSEIVNPVTYGFSVTGSGIGNVHNSVIRTDGSAYALADEQSSDGAVGILTASHVTMVRSGGSDTHPAIRSAVQTGATGSTNMNVNNSIVRGYLFSYDREAPIDGATSGSALLGLRYSDFASGTDGGDGSLTMSNNINADPLFAGPTDFHLLAGSPAIDTADPNPSPALTDDFDGALRPVDGNGDGTALRDMGAYEYQPPAPPPTGNPQTPTTPSTPTTPAKKCKKKKKRPASAAKKCKKKR
jgi:hypothetical protein